MDPTPIWNRGTFSAGLDALRLARRATMTRDVVESTRRIGHALRRAADNRGFVSLSEAALAMEMTDEHQWLSVVEILITRLMELPQDESSVVPRILIVESDAQMARLLDSILTGADREIFVAKSVAEAFVLVQEKAIALVVLDLQLPDSDGRNFLLGLRERPATSLLPVIVLSGLAGALPKAECYALGAEAFFEKPIAPDVLKAAISMRLHQSLETRRELRHDALTGLPNRAAFEDMFTRLTSLSERRREPIAMALIDFDHLRQVNHKYGYAAGDSALQLAAQALNQSLRKSDYLVRWGGDEFAMLLPATSLDGARRAVGKALQKLRQNPIALPDGQILNFSFSAGVVPILPKAGLETTLSEADRYLFVAKSSGRKKLVTEKNKERMALPLHKILLVENDLTLSQSISNSLRSEGFEIQPCLDIYAAIRAVAATNYTLCLLDLAVGGQETQMLLQEIHRRGEKRPRVLLLTDPNQEAGRGYGYQMGADDYLVKPFSAFDLMSQVHKMLKR